MKGIEKDSVVEFIKDNFSEMIGSISIFTMVLLLLLLKRQYIVTILGCLSIVAIALERRAKGFDRIVSILVILCLAVGFMLFQ
jgi:hypothetical protein